MKLLLDECVPWPVGRSPSSNFQPTICAASRPQPHLFNRPSPASDRANIAASKSPEAEPAGFSRPKTLPVS
ncbi:MAG: hypothetical protein HY736_16955 [Verrucomicrobia bacterium]|nr:hypothetical protein [Verrucomicrobiota bacterium]